MPIEKIQGLRGLSGLSSLSPSERSAFMKANANELREYNNPFQREQVANILYMNQRFINTFGRDAFDKMNDGTKDAFDMRNEALKQKVVHDELVRYGSPFRANGTRDNKKGLGANWEKALELSPDAQMELLQSGYLNATEFNNKWKKYADDDMRATAMAPMGALNPLSGIVSSIGTGINELFKKGSTGSTTGDILHATFGKEAARQHDSELNQKIFDTIYNNDLDRKASELGDQVSQEYLNTLNLSDSQIKNAFVKTITKGSYVSKNGIPNTGIAEYESHYGKGKEGQISSEMEDFTIDNMRQVLAKKKVYETYMSPEAAATALNNDAKRYIKDHQGFFKQGLLYSKDVGISALSYTADKINGIAELGRQAEDRLFDKPTVWIDDKGNVVDPNKGKIVRDRKGAYYYQGKDNSYRPIHQHQISRATLHQMGKNDDGSDIEGAFGTDWMTLNPQYWSRAEQFGTLDKDLQKQYEKIGSSPYKIAYDPNEESSLWYEAFKMMSFGAADQLSMFIPFGIGAVGKSLSVAGKVGKIARGFEKALDTTGKLLSAESKTGQVLQGTAGALGISYAYGRGAFQEILQQNLANAEEAVLNAGREDINKKYHTDKAYKTQVDKQINARASQMAANYMAQASRERGPQLIDKKVLMERCKADATNEVLGKLVQQRVKERMSSKEYADLQQKAIDGAGDAAFNTFWPEALKYGFVNNLGFRKFLYQNPARLTRKASSSLKGLREVTTDAGKKRLAVGTDYVNKAGEVAIKKSKFQTVGDKWKELDKTAASQLWGGAWTNGTDDMQVDAAERINNDSFDKYLQAYRNGEAMADVYGFADGIYSYVKGLQNSLGQESTWRSAEVGGLGSILSSNINFANIASLASREGRDAYKNNFWRELERDKDGIPQRDEKGNLKYKDLKKGNNWREQANFFIQNGVLNTYYGKKQSERDLQSHADYVNNLLDDYNDFMDIEKLVAASNAFEESKGTQDEKTTQFVKAFHTINVLNNLANNSKDPTTMSSVVQNAKSMVERAAQLNTEDLENGRNPLGDEEVEFLLKQYYAENPSLEHNMYNDRKGLEIIGNNARKLQEATQAFNDAEEEIQRIEKSKGMSVSPLIRTDLALHKALDSHWRERKQKMQDEIGDTSTEEKPQDSATVIASIGGKKNAERLIKVYDRQKEEIKKALEKQHKKTEEAEKKYKTVTVYSPTEDTAGESNVPIGTSQAERARMAKAELENAKERENYLKDLLRETEDKRTSLLLHNASVNVKGEEKILTADEIFALDPITRARMMSKDNRELYNEKQQKEIEKLERRLTMEGNESLQKIQDIAVLTQRINANQDAYSRMVNNPVAAAYNAEEQRNSAAQEAKGIIDHRNAETVADMLNRFDENMEVHADATDEKKQQYVFEQLKPLRANILDIIDKEKLLPKYQQQVKDAIDFSKTVEDLAAVIGMSGRGEKWMDNVSNHIDGIVKSSKDRQEILSKMEKVIDDTAGSEASRDFEYVLNEMKDMGYQRDATIIESRQKRWEREFEEQERKEKQKEKENKEKEAKEESRGKESVEVPKKKDEEEPNIPMNDKGYAYNEREEEDAFKDADLEKATLKPDGMDLSGYVGENGATSSESDTESSSAGNTAAQGEKSLQNEGKEENLEEGNKKPLGINDLLKDDVQEGVVDAGEIWNGTDNNPQKVKLTIEKKGDVISFKAGAHMVNINLLPNEYTMPNEEEHKGRDYTYSAFSMKKVDGNWTFLGNFVDEKTESRLPMKKNFDLEKAVERAKEESEALALSLGKDIESPSVTVTENGIEGNTPTIEEQAEELRKKGISVEVTSLDNVEKETPNDSSSTNSIEEGMAASNTLTGTGMREYDTYPNSPLVKNGILERRKPRRDNDPLSTYFKWMDAEGIKLQNIMDRELAKILQENPNAKIKFLCVRNEDNATHDTNMQKHLLLVLDYDDNINKGITSIHDNRNGGVLESQGKKYLVVGVAGFIGRPDGNPRNIKQRDLYDKMWNLAGENHLNIKIDRKNFFAKHPDERFYVDEKYSTEIKPYSLLPGYRVRQLENESKPSKRSVVELIEDDKRNPLGLRLEDVAWGIQELDKFVIVNKRNMSSDKVMVPRDIMGNRGRAFVLVPASNGKYFPGYFEPLMYNEMRDGELKKEADVLLSAVASPDYKESVNAIKELFNIFYISKEGDNILRNEKYHTLTLIHNGEPFKSFTIDNAFDKTEFMKAVEQMNPRINITARVLGDPYLIRKYAEAGAMQTDLALFHTAGTSFSIYGLDSNGDMLIPENPSNSNGGKEFERTVRQLVYNHRYYREVDGEYSINGEPVKDEAVLKQLRQIRRILDNGLAPVRKEGIMDYYIMSNGAHPEVVKIDGNSKEVTELSGEDAERLIAEVAKEELERQRKEAAKKELESQEDSENTDLNNGDTSDSDFTINTETGLAKMSSKGIEQATQPTKEENIEIVKEEKETGQKEDEEQYILHIFDSQETKPKTQTFKELYKSKKYKTQIVKVIRSKWKDVPNKAKDLEEFLKSKDIIVEGIGTSDADVQAWMKTIEECR